LSNGDADIELFHFKGNRQFIEDGVFIDSIESDLLKSLIGDYVTYFMSETSKSFWTGFVSIGGTIQSEWSISFLSCSIFWIYKE